MGVMMQSVCVNNPDVDVTFHIIIDDSVTDICRHDLEHIVEPFSGKSAVFYSANNDILATNFPKGADRLNLTIVTYYRLFITELLPHTIDKVLYLDGDIIVRHSLLPLWNYDLDNYAVAAVHDSICHQSWFYDRLRYPSQLGYFNAGVLLINLKYWREHAIMKDFLNYMQEHPEDIIMHDQDVLNVVLKDRKILLPIKYNLNCGYIWKDPLYDVQKYEKEVLEACQDPVIVHFTSGKPWESYKSHSHPFHSTFYKYQKQTIWKGKKIERRPLKMRIRNMYSDILRLFNRIPPIRSYNFIKLKPID